MSEDKLQSEMVKWFNNNFCLKHHSPRSIIWSVPNGGFRNKLEATRLKATGLLAGVSDLIIVHKSIVYFCEIKTDKGKQSTSQKDFELRIKENGFTYVIFNSLTDFQQFFINL